LILEITDSVKHFTRPAEVFRQTIKNLNSRKFILPGYDFLSTNISREVYRRKLFLSRIINESLSVNYRLIENMVICWNYLYLTQKLTELNTENEKQELLETFKNSSIITWQHINFHGEYDFSEEKTRDSIGFNLPKILSWKLEENGK